MYSIRESLQGKLLDFVHASGFSCVPLDGLIRDIVASLAGYREEDKPLFPEVYVFNSPACKRALTLSPDVPINMVPLADGTGAAILKDCAPLAVEGWAIFIVRETETTVRYGLFRAQNHSLSISADEAMRSLGKEQPIILIRSRGHQTVEVINSNGHSFIAIFKATQALPPELDAHISKLVRSIAADPSCTADFRAYLVRLLVGIIQRCHGTLLAVAPAGTKATTKALSDSVTLNPPVNLRLVHKRASQEQTAEGLAELQAIESLLEGMIQSDGMVMFGNDGTVLGYRTILKVSSTEAKILSTTGGARRKAFETMKMRVPNVFQAVFFRSQDGDTACLGGTDVDD